MRCSFWFIDHMSRFSLNAPASGAAIATWQHQQCCTACFGFRRCCTAHIASGWSCTAHLVVGWRWTAYRRHRAAYRRCQKRRSETLASGDGQQCEDRTEVFICVHCQRNWPTETGKYLCTVCDAFPLCGTCMSWDSCKACATDESSGG